jgi:hypothetical protein
VGVLGNISLVNRRSCYSTSGTRLTARQRAIVSTSRPSAKAPALTQLPDSLACGTLGVAEVERISLAMHVMTWEHLGNHRARQAQIRRTFVGGLSGRDGHSTGQASCLLGIFCVLEWSMRPWTDRQPRELAWSGSTNLEKTSRSHEAAKRRGRYPASRIPWRNGALQTSAPAQRTLKCC